MGDTILIRTELPGVTFEVRTDSTLLMNGERVGTLSGEQFLIVAAEADALLHDARRIAAAMEGEAE
jgi:hypothetical protein